MRSGLELLRETVDKWQQDEAPRLGASLAYYAVFSMAPLLVIVIAIISFVYRGDTVGQIQWQLQSLFGNQAAETIAQAIKNASTRQSGFFASVTSFIVLGVGATGVFSELRYTMNKVWKVPPDAHSGIVVGIIKDRFAAFTMVLGIAFLLLVSMIISAILTAIVTYFRDLLPSAGNLWTLADFGISFSVVTVLFAALFRYVPDTRVDWQDVWIGAIATALLFNAGKFVIAWYLGHSGIASIFGAAGSIVVILAWVYYSSQLVFLGAEFTYVYAKRRGSRRRAEDELAA